MSRYRVYAKSEAPGSCSTSKQTFVTSEPALPTVAARVPHVMVTQFIAGLPRRLLAQEVADWQEQPRNIAKSAVHIQCRGWPGGPQTQRTGSAKVWEQEELHGVRPLSRPARPIQPMPYHPGQKHIGGGRA